MRTAFNILGLLVGLILILYAFGIDVYSLGIFFAAGLFLIIVLYYGLYQGRTAFKIFGLLVGILLIFYAFEISSYALGIFFAVVLFIVLILYYGLYQSR